MQAVGKKLEADLADLKSRLKMQEMETRKANAKYVSSITTQEKLKTEFDAERKAWVNFRVKSIYYVSPKHFPSKDTWHLWANAY